MTDPAATRLIHYACPDCPTVETQRIMFTPRPEVAPPPDEETYLCRCPSCFSKKLDAVYPGVREWGKRRLLRRAKRVATNRKPEVRD